MRNPESLWAIPGIAELPKHQIHAIGAIVTNQSQEILMVIDQDRLVQRERKNNGQRSVPFGKIDINAGETYRKGTAREVREETGLDLEEGLFRPLGELVIVTENYRSRVRLFGHHGEREADIFDQAQDYKKNEIAKRERRSLEKVLNTDYRLLRVPTYESLALAFGLTLPTSETIKIANGTYTQDPITTKKLLRDLLQHK